MLKCGLYFLMRFASVSNASASFRTVMNSRSATVFTIERTFGACFAPGRKYDRTRLRRFFAFPT